MCAHFALKFSVSVNINNVHRYNNTTRQHRYAPQYVSAYSYVVQINAGRAGVSGRNRRIARLPLVQ